MIERFNVESSGRAEELRDRTKKFALQIVRLFRALPKTDEARVLGKQVLRSGTSVAANYRSACRARSRAEFLSKICIVLEEADETEFWLELLEETGVIDAARLAGLLAETRELVRIFSSSRRTARARLAAGSSNHTITQSHNHTMAQ